MESKTKVQLSVFQRGGEYFATRTFPSNMPSFSPPGVVFSITEDVTPDETNVLEERAKQEARKRGIARVINLD